MAKAVDRNTLTYAYAANPYSNATGEVPVNSLKSSVSKCESPSTTTTIGFLSRDPIGFEGSEWNVFVYGDSNPIATSDPTGKVTVNFQTAWGGCKSGGNASFYVSGDGANVSPLGASLAPCNGYVIERVDASCSKKKCPCEDGPDPAKGSETWLSAYPLKKGASFNKSVAVFTAPAHKGCGYYGFNATYWYLCKEDLPQPIENLPGWGKLPPVKPNADMNCFRPKGNLTLKLGQGNTDPVLTAQSSSGEKVGNANAQFNYCCCNKPSDYYLVGYSASDDDFGGLVGF